MMTLTTAAKETENISMKISSSLLFAIIAREVYGVPAFVMLIVYLPASPMLLEQRKTRQNGSVCLKCSLVVTFTMPFLCTNIIILGDGIACQLGLVIRLLCKIAKNENLIDSV